MAETAIARVSAVHKLQIWAGVRMEGGQRVVDYNRMVSGRPGRDRDMGLTCLRVCLVGAGIFLVCFLLFDFDWPVPRGFEGWI